MIPWPVTFCITGIALKSLNVAVAEEESVASAEGEGETKQKPPPNVTLESCRSHLLHVNAHGAGFWDPASLDRYHRCLWVLRHEAQPARHIFVGGQHQPTLLVTNHREPSMRLPPEKPPPRPLKSHERIPLQAFQDTQQEFAGLEGRVPHHFVVPFFDTNIGNIIKNQGSMNHYQSYQMQMMLRPGDVAIDVGGNLGCYTVALAEKVGPGGRVLAFEPYRWMHQLLTANVALNGLQNVWPVQAALGSSRSTLPLLPPQLRFFSSPGGVRVAEQAGQVEGRPQHEAFQLYDLNARELENVRVERLDDLLLDEAEGLRWGLPVPLADVRLIKIDVEGMETAVMEGAVGVLSTYKPIVWSENNAYFDSNGKDTSFLQVMASVGYSCAKSPSAPTDVICTHDSGQGHSY